MNVFQTLFLDEHNKEKCIYGQFEKMHDTTNLIRENIDYTFDSRCVLEFTLLKSNLNQKK